MKKLLLIAVLPVVLLAYTWNSAYTTGLQYVWLFDEGAGSTAHDRYASAADLTLSGPTWSGGGLSITGSSDSVQSAANTAHSDAFTYIIWFKRTTISFSNCSMGAQYTSGSGDWFFYLAGDNKVYVDIPFVAGGVLASTNTFTDTASIHQYALTRTGSTGSWTWKFYFDGSLDTNSPNSNNPNTAASKFNVGYPGGPSWPLNGIVYQAAFWNADIGATAIAGLVNRNNILGYAPSVIFGSKALIGSKVH